MAGAAGSGATGASRRTTGAITVPAMVPARGGHGRRMAAAVGIAEAAGDAVARRRADAPALVGRPQQRDQRVGHRGGVAIGHDDPGPALQRFPRAAAVGERDHRPAGRHRLSTTPGHGSVRAVDSMSAAQA
jgi:hypothetical protein